MKIDIYDIYDEVKFTADIDCAENAKGSWKLRLAVLWAIDNNISLQRAYLQGANLNGTCLENVNLRGADLNWADLRSANLRDADLLWADLSEADLRGADLRGADLR